MKIANESKELKMESRRWSISPVFHSIAFKLGTIVMICSGALALAACGGDEPNTPIDNTVKINIGTLGDFTTNQNTPKNDDKTYLATVTADIKTDSIGLAQTLVKWNELDQQLSNTTTNWAGFGIMANGTGIVFDYESYKNAGGLKIKQNPNIANTYKWPYSKNLADSTSFAARGYNLRVKREPTPPKDTVKIELGNIGDFETKKDIPQNNDKIYRANVINDIKTDSIGLSKTLVNWKTMNNQTHTLTTDWKNFGIMANAEGVVFDYESYKNAGGIKIKPNPNIEDIYKLPYSRDIADSTKFANDYSVNLRVKRPAVIIPPEPGYFEIPNIETLLANWSVMAKEPLPFTVKVTGDLVAGNSDIATLELALALWSDSRVTKTGNINVAGKTDSVAITAAFINKLKSVNGNKWHKIIIRIFSVFSCMRR